jgi:hypothetical protein
MGGDGDSEAEDDAFRCFGRKDGKELEPVVMEEGSEEAALS